MSTFAVSSQLWWHVARVGGLLSWAMLALSMVWGLMISSKSHPARMRPNWLLDLHRFLGGTAVAFTGIHIAGLMLDSYVSFGPVELLIPFTSSYRPGAVALGVCAFYLLMAVEITSLLRSRIKRTTWKKIHALSFGLYIVGTAHGITAGSDSGWTWLQYVMVATTAIIVALTVLRIDESVRRSQRKASRPAYQHRSTDNTGAAPLPPSENPTPSRRINPTTPYPPGMVPPRRSHRPTARADRHEWSN